MFSLQDSDNFLFSCLWPQPSLSDGDVRMCYGCSLSREISLSDRTYVRRGGPRTGVLDGVTGHESLDARAPHINHRSSRHVWTRWTGSGPWSSFLRPNLLHHTHVDPGSLTLPCR